MCKRGDHPLSMKSPHAKPPSPNMRTPLNIDSSQWPEIWQAAYRILEQSIAPNQLRAWIQPLEMVKSEQIEGGLRVHFAAANDFSAQWVRDHYRKAMETAFAQVTGVN